MNQIICVGRLTKDCDLRYTQTQTAVVSFTLAVKRDYKDKDNKDIVDFIPVTIFKKEKLAQYLLKGTLVAVEGSLNIDKWTDKNGNWQTRTVVVARNIELLSYVKKEEKAAEFEFVPSQEFAAMDDSEIPF